MKQNFFLIFSIFFCIGAKAQSGLFVVGGASKTNLFVSPTGYETKFTDGYNNWQAGASAQFAIEKKGFLYAGLFYETKTTSKESIVCCVMFDSGSYRPQYITVPFGGGIQIPISESVHLKFSGGAYVSLGVGGNAEGIAGAGDIGPMHIAPYNRKIYFGGAEGYDFTRWNWGLQVGTAIAWKKLELQFSYNHGISNTTPDNTRTNGGYLVTKYRTTQLNLAYRLFTFKK